MKQTVVGVFESPLSANETLHVLLTARFVAERLPPIGAPGATQRQGSMPRRLLDALARKCRIFMAADMYLQPYASALARGRFVLKVHAADPSETVAARRILEAAGGKEVEVLEDYWFDG